MHLRLTLQSDATFGRGDGVAGFVDTEVEHDLATGLPYLRGRTLKGLLVEECANVLYALEAAAPPAAQRLQGAARFLFGAPGSTPGAEAALRVGRARLPEALRQAVARDVRDGKLRPSEVLDALTALRHQTAVDDATGAPAPGSLRTARVVLRATTLYAPLTFRRPPTDDALALLAACARAVHRAGTARNRGRGRLRLRLYPSTEAARSAPPAARDEIAEATTREHYRHFEALVQDGSAVAAPQEIDGPAQPDPGPAPAPDTTRGATVVVRLRLEQPVIATTVEGDPNSSVSFDYVPGAVLRGAVIARYLGRQGEDLAAAEDLAGQDARARRLFFDGTTQFLNGYPLVEDSHGDLHRTHPTPLSYHHEKGRPETLYDFTVSAPEAGDEPPQWQRASTPFMAAAGGGVLLEQPARHVTVHTQRDRKAGRPTKRDGVARGTVFRYDALAAGTVVEGAICCQDPDDADLLREVLAASPLLTLGGARSVDYGRARITDLRQVPGRWHEMGTAPVALREDGRLVVLLLSDALVRTAHGQAAPDAEALVAAINRALDLDGAARLTPRRAFVRHDVVGGFNRTWGLPLPQALAAKKGSVLVLAVPDAAPDDLAGRLDALERGGIGERRAEGFGRLAINRHADAPSDVAQTVSEPDDAPLPTDPLPTEHDPEAHHVATQMAERLLRRHLDLALVKRSGPLAEGITQPSPSQLARVRSAFRAALDQDPQKGCDAVATFLEALPHDARQQLRQDRLHVRQGTGTLLDWLKERVEDARPPGGADARIWQELGVPRAGGAYALPRIGSTAQARLTAALAYEYNLRLAYHALARAAKQKRQQAPH